MTLHFIAMGIYSSVFILQQEQDYANLEYSIKREDLFFLGGGRERERENQALSHVKVIKKYIIYYFHCFILHFNPLKDFVLNNTLVKDQSHS
jgi:hypothetical protein